MANIGVAVLGVGRMGKRRALAVTKNSNCELNCIVDFDVSISEFAKKLGCDYYPNYHEALDREDVDAVIASLPNDLHKPITIRSLEKHKHVFCEKPLARTSEEARTMVETSIKNRVYLKTGSNVRFFKNIIKAKELLDAGEIGDVLFSRAWIGHGGWNLKKGSWFTNPNQIGGGTLLDNGCHLIDILRWFNGEIVECLGYCTTQFHPIKGLEDNAMAIVVGETGIPSFIQASWTEWNGYLYIEIYGQEGILQVDNRGDRDRVTLKYKDSSQTEVFDFSEAPKTSFKDEVDHFIESIMTKKQPKPSGYDGMRAVQIIDGIYESAKQGVKIKVFSEEDKKLKRELETVEYD